MAAGFGCLTIAITRPASPCSNANKRRFVLLDIAANLMELPYIFPLLKSAGKSPLAKTVLSLSIVSGSGDFVPLHRCSRKKVNLF